MSSRHPRGADGLPTGTIRLSHGSSVIQSLRQEMAPPPPPEELEALTTVVPVGDSIACPECAESFDICADFYGAVGECAECGAEFLIGHPAEREPRPRRVTTSGIEVGETSADARVTGTIKLDHGLSMVQKLRQEMAPPPPREAVAKLPVALASDDEVTCPVCAASFEITPELHGLAAECADCGHEFLIRSRATAEAEPLEPEPAARPGSRPFRVKRAENRRAIILIVLLIGVILIASGLAIAWISLS